MASPKIPCSSLSPFDKAGYLTKQGGSYKSWKRRWFILKGTSLYYFKTTKDLDVTGIILITKESFVKREATSKKKNCFAVGTVKRVFFLYPDADKPEETEEWINEINRVIQSLNTTAKPIQISSSSTTKVEQPLAESQLHVQVKAAPTSTGTRKELVLAKDCVPFLSPGTQMIEFWVLWMESLPLCSDLSEGSILFEVATSASMEKIIWHSSGTQAAFIQKMVDFFWNVGAPENEIDRLSDIGAAINPSVIGSWIEISNKGGMDGGWFFPVELPTRMALEASDEGPAVTKLCEWTEQNLVEKCYYLSRDMGASPPRQTETKFQLPGNLDNQLRLCSSAFKAFGFSNIPAEAIDIIRRNPPKDTLCISVTTSAEGFVKLGVIITHPSPSLFQALSKLVAVDLDKIHQFQKALSVEQPLYVELHELSTGFGYEVYKEGFDVTFHYCAGEEYYSD